MFPSFLNPEGFDSPDLVPAAKDPTHETITLPSGSKVSAFSASKADDPLSEEHKKVIREQSAEAFKSLPNYKSIIEEMASGFTGSRSKDYYEGMLTATCILSGGVIKYPLLSVVAPGFLSFLSMLTAIMMNQYDKAASPSE